MKRSSTIALLALVPAVAWGFWAGLAGMRESRPSAPHWVVNESERVVLRSPAGFQTVTQKGGTPTGLYYDAGGLVGQLRPSARTVALLGLGGGEMLRAAWRSLSTDKMHRFIGVEIDQKTAELAVSQFHVDELGVEVVVADALDWIAAQPKASLDVVMVDVYADSVLPEPFRRLAFFIDCARALRPTSGLLLMNVWPRALVPEVRKNLEVLFTVTEQMYGPNTVLIAEIAEIR